MVRARFQCPASISLSAGVGSAWLIRKFIDPKARFIFAAKPSAHPQAIPYDMFEVEFTHHGEDCTFETMVKRFGIPDKSVQTIAEMIHDADVEDEKFQRPECMGLDRMFKGWAQAHGDERTGVTVEVELHSDGAH